MYVNNILRDLPPAKKIFRKYVAVVVRHAHKLFCVTTILWAPVSTNYSTETILWFSTSSHKMVTSSFSLGVRCNKIVST